MSEYIERKMVIAKNHGGVVYIEDIKNIPSADVAPVRHGCWGNYEPYSDGYRCSYCNLVHRTCTTYCPNCGAKMDLEERS